MARPMRSTASGKADAGSKANRTTASRNSSILRERVPKYVILNELLAAEDLERFDFVVNIDDDIVLPDRFLDQFLPLQARLQFAIGQPARTSNSFIDHPIVEQQRGALARETLFVEIGPVLSVHRCAFDIVFPFDLSSPMGWGYENVWSHRASAIDPVAVQVPATGSNNSADAG